jgi:predicted RNA-binding Zn ribbon-like protein
MNTIWADRSGVYDALADEAGALAWLRAVEPRLPRSPAVDRWLRDVSSTDPSTELSEATEGLRRLRDALRRVAATRTADPRPAAASAIEDVLDAVGVVNEAAAAAPRWSALEPGADGFARRSRTGASPATAITALLAEDGIDVCAGPPGDELRACLAPGCVLYFVRQHPRREWCSSACGNRARAARHYQRHRKADIAT